MTSHTYISATMYLCFVVTVNVLLFNMLIASMSTTYAEISEYKRFHCYTIRMTDVILLETMLPRFMQSRLRQMYRRLRVTLHISHDVTDSYDMYLLEADDRQEAVRTRGSKPSAGDKKLQFANVF